MEKIVKGTMFIVPNGLRTVYAKCGINNLLETYKTLGIEVEKDEMATAPLVEIWTFDPNLSSNWSDHGVDLTKVGFQDEELCCSWPSHFPAALFEGKKEGEKLLLSAGGLEFEFELAQTTTRYARYGRFEDVLSYLLKKFNSEEEKEWRKKYWTAESAIW